MRERDSIEKGVFQAIDASNAHWAPLAKARLIARRGDSLLIEFSGCYCGACSFYDYFEDLQTELEESGIPTALESITETESGAIVEFRLHLGEY